MNPRNATQRDLGPVRIRLVTDFSNVEFEKQTNYRIIVEGWAKHRHGRIRRAFERAFDHDERRRLSNWHVKLRRWHLQTGTPDRVDCPPADLQLLRKAANFFGAL